jgi:hypothetical protein
VSAVFVSAAGQQFRLTSCGNFAGSCVQSCTVSMWVLPQDIALQPLAAALYVLIASHQLCR